MKNNSRYQYLAVIGGALCDCGGHNYILGSELLTNHSMCETGESTMARTKRMAFVLFIITPLIFGLVSAMQAPISEQNDLGNVPLTAKIAVIYINSNGDFAAYATGGSGNATHPWIIENNVTDAGGLVLHGIAIFGTTAYFILRNCTITNTDSGYNGIYIESARNGVVTNCTVADCNFIGITIEDGININVTNCVSRDNSGAGIYIQDCENCSVINNTVKNCIYGIDLYSQGSCSNNLIFNNTLWQTGLYEVGS